MEKNYQELKSILEKLNFKKENLELVNVWRLDLPNEKMFRIDFEHNKLTFLQRNEIIIIQKFTNSTYIKLMIMAFIEFIKNDKEIPSLTLIEFNESIFAEASFSIIYQDGKSCVYQLVSQIDNHRDEILDLLKKKKTTSFNLTVICKETFKLRTNVEVLKERLGKRINLNKLENTITKNK